MSAVLRGRPQPSTLLALGAAFAGLVSIVSALMPERADRLRREAAARSRARRRERTRKAGTARFLLLISAIIGTAVIVTIVMFQVRAAVMS